MGHRYRLLRNNLAIHYSGNDRKRRCDVASSKAAALRGSGYTRPPHSKTARALALWRSLAGLKPGPYIIAWRRLGWVGDGAPFLLGRRWSGHHFCLQSGRRRSDCLWRRRAGRSLPLMPRSRRPASVVRLFPAIGFQNQRVPDHLRRTRKLWRRELRLRLAWHLWVLREPSPIGAGL